jgi:OOP family OmpA-OmpF porin
MMRKSLMPAAAVALLFSGLALAEDTYYTPGQHYLGVLGTYIFNTDEDRGPNIDYATGFRVLYGTQTASRFGYEFQGFGDIYETGHSGIKDFYRYGGGIDLFYALGDRTGFTPYLLVGGTYQWNDAFPDNRDSNDWGANAGVGIVSPPFTRVGNLKIRAEGRYIYDTWENSYRDMQASLGIEIPLFEPHQAETMVPPPAPAAVVQVVEVPTGLTDSDGDGVIDDKDQCPGTPAGDRVDGHGCTLQKVIALKGVNFEFDSAKLRPDAEGILAEQVETLKKYPDMKVEVAGHTDSKGSDEYNVKLSQRRAQSVMDFFVTAGVPATQLGARGYGESQPISTNDTDEGREENRRVELRILN